MKKIICFITSLSSGGAEHQMSILANLLDEKGYDVSVATYVDVDDMYDISPSIKRINICRGEGPLSKFFGIFLFFLKTDADCIISFGQRENFLCLLPMLFKPNSIVVSGERNLTIGKPSFIERVLFSILYKRSDYIVPNSFSQRTYILSKKPSYRKKCFTITNYTELEKYTYRGLPLNEKARIGVFCRYNPQKNYERFVAAISLVKKQCEIPFVVECYGNIKFKDGRYNLYYLKIKELIKGLGLEDTIVLKDHVRDTSTKMFEYDALALPSLHEGFSNSVAEGICTGRPMLVSNVSDNSIMVKDGVNGFLFNPYDSNSMSTAIISYLRMSNAERMEMGRNSRLIAEELFDKNIFINSYIKLVEGNEYSY